MCDVKTKNKGKGNLSITCQISGKPITNSNKYGMFCEDMCELEKIKQSSDQLESMLSGFLSLFDETDSDV